MACLLSVSSLCFSQTDGCVDVPGSYRFLCLAKSEPEQPSFGGPLCSTVLGAIVLTTRFKYLMLFIGNIMFLGNGVGLFELDEAGLRGRGVEEEV